MATNNRDYKFQTARIGHLAPSIFSDQWESLGSTLDALIARNGYEPGAVWKLGDTPDGEKYPPKTDARNDFFKSHPTSYLAFTDSQFYECGSPNGYQDFLVSCYTVQTNSRECKAARDERKKNPNAKMPESEFAPKIFVHLRGKRSNGKFLPDSFEFNANTNPEEGPVWKKLPRKGLKDSQEIKNAVIYLYPEEEMGELKQPGTADAGFIIVALLKNAQKFRTARLREDLEIEDSENSVQEDGDNT